MSASGDDRGTAAEGPKGVDPGGLERWFAGNVPGARPPLAFERISGGRSNLTYRVTDASGRSWALRRPPLGERLASAHDMAREHRVVSALATTPVPVAPVVALCEDEAVTGAPFYLMEFVDGPVLRSRADAEAAFRPEARRAIGERVADTLAAIHAVDPAAVGLGDLGRTEGYVARQLRRWHGQWEKSKQRELALIDDVHERLEARIPEQGPATIVHGDYRLDNMILTDSGEVAAVVDWELCTLGDPLADVGLLMIYWGSEDEQLTPLGEAPTLATGFPTREQAAKRYAERSGRDLSRLDFYLALGYWKLAIILEGVLARYTAGQYGEQDEAVAQFARVVERLAEAAGEAERRSR
ncbi:MAG TPA: phosphotransferase family protein [Solirubrobacterales bacterium]|nr:phosphotransferase family protein [Solirubrobacterales bacterium]